MRLQHVVLASLLASAALACDPAPIAAPSEDPALEGWEEVEGFPDLPPGEELGRVLGVAVGPDGRVWISHTGDGEHPEIIALDPNSGAVVDAIDASAMRSPHALAWDDAGQLWVTDDALNRVFVLDAKGRTLRTLGSE